MNIFISNYKGESDIMLYTEIDLPMEKVENFVRKGCKASFDEIYPIDDDEVQYYCIDESVWFNEEKCRIINERF